MKKIILGLGIVLSLISCSNESKMKSGLKDYFDKNANDPKSYEFVELKVFDTITLGEVAERAPRYIAQDIAEYTELMYIPPIATESLILYENEERKERIKAKQIAFEKFSPDKEKIKPFLNSKEIVLYNVSHTYRLKNALGALGLSSSDFVFDKDFNIVKIVSEGNDVHQVNYDYCYRNYFNKN